MHIPGLSAVIEIHPEPFAGPAGCNVVITIDSTIIPPAALNTLRTELYDIERTIHMDRDAPPADEPRSRLGYSVGTWEGSDLVVRTTRLNWPYFDNIGTPLSEDVQIVERFSLSEDQTRLDFEVTVTDPSTFTSPATLAGYWQALGETIPPYDCQPLER